MQSNNRRLYRLARGILRNDGEAEDVVQETYVRAFTHLDGFRGDRCGHHSDDPATIRNDCRASLDSCAGPVYIDYMRNGT